MRSLPFQLATAVRFANLLELLKYGLASAAALAVDWGLLILLTTVGGLHYLMSAAISFCTGGVLVYLLSIGFVFRLRRFAEARIEFALFFVIGLVGLVLTQLILRALVDGAGLNYAVAKLPTAGIVFMFDYTLRRVILFSGPRLGPKKSAS
ncbi:MAG: GtrA family protein [Methylobacteriaceae bacterium]|nr:GtrA family protein [Methylobacteriaceae bacterium]